jgi:hypothetical protein
MRAITSGLGGALGVFGCVKMLMNRMDSVSFCRCDERRTAESTRLDEKSTTHVDFLGRSKFR